jgi:hypothetical protein
MQIQAGDAYMAENMEEPAADNSAYNAQKHIENNSLASMIHQMTRNEAGD